MAENQKAQAQEKAPVEIKYSDIVKMLDNGQDRREIAKHYGVTLATIKQIFQDPKLKGRKVKPRTPVTLIDDLPDEGKEGKASDTKEAAATTGTQSESASQSASSESASTGTQEQASTPSGDANKAVW